MAVIIERKVLKELDIDDGLAKYNFVSLLLIVFGMVLRDFHITNILRISEILTGSGFLLFFIKNPFSMYGTFKDVRKNKLLIYILFLVSGFVSCFFSKSVSLSLFKNCECLYLIIFAILVSEVIKGNLKHAVDCLLIAAVVISIFAFVQYVLQDFYFFKPYSLNYLVSRSSATMSDPNYMGLFLAISAIFAIHKSEIKFMVLTLVIYLGIFFPFSRSAIIIILVSNFIIGIYVLYTKKRDWFSRLLILALATLVLVGLNLKFRSTMETFRSELDIRRKMEDISSKRISLLKSAVNETRSLSIINKFLGKGPGQSVERIGFHFHNNYLTVNYERGLMGLFCFYAFWLMCILALLKNANDYNITIVCAIVGWMVCSLFLDTTHELIIWFVLGMFFANEKNSLHNS